MGNYLVYTTADGGSKWMELISILRNSSSGEGSSEAVPATGITLNKTTLSFTDSSSQTLIAVVEPSNSTDSVTWETSDAGIATVSGGVVSPVSNGFCTITAKAGSYSASCEVTVNVSGEIVTLQSISVTYTGGEVTVGTALTDLTGITVTAHYSDGSTDTITGYALSGEIVEGKNTITVSYGGKTTTFTVTGVAESGGEEVAVTDLGSGNMKWYSDGGDTLLQQMTRARSYTGVFEEETEVQVAVIVNETQYSVFYIGAYDGTDITTGYYAKKFEISGYPSAGETYTTTYTVPSGYGVIVGGWSGQGNVTVKVVKIGV